MQIVYARTSLPASFTRALFLAGPTPRDPETTSWRPEALKILEELGFDGVVFVPEDEGGGMHGGYSDQIEWEEACLHLADCIVFWIPRALPGMPAFTTNVEWGVWHDSQKVVLGAPPGAPKLRYLRHYAKKLGVPQSDSLRDTLSSALARMGEGALRVGGEREVPLRIWRRGAFQSWYRAQRAAGNRLDGARLVWQYMGGPRRRRSLFCWALQVNMYVAREDRNKRSEVIVSRPDVAAVLAYRRGARPGDTRVVLVREFRSAAATYDGFVHELPSGSSAHDERDPRHTAAEELREETGVDLDATRFQMHPARQCGATLTTHRAHLFSIELTEEELIRFQEEGARHGENISERTYVEVRTLDQILAANDVDWTHLGMILSVLHE